MKFPSRLIQFWLPERLIPFENNPRTHSDAQVRQTAWSMQKFGFINPLIVDENSGLIAGQVACGTSVGLKYQSSFLITCRKPKSGPTSSLITSWHGGASQQGEV